MEAASLHYDHQFQLIVCIEHDYCIAFKVLKQHLQRLHEIKEESLRAIVIEASQLLVREPRQINVSIDNSLISYLSIDIEYRCEYIACDEKKDALNKNKRTMKRHLTKKHNIENEKEKIQFTFNDVQTICVQSFCTSDNYRLFVVDVKRDRNDISSIFFVVEVLSSHATIFSHAINEVFDSMQMKLKQEYERNQRD